MANPDIKAAVQGYRPLDQLIPAHWQEGTIRADDGTRLRYWRGDCDRPSVVLLHGFQNAGLTWLRVAKALEAEYDVVMPDFRGHGQSDGPEKGFSLDVLTGDTAAIIRTLKLEKPFVLGHSLGAEVAGRLAADYPDWVGAIILEEPPMQRFTTPPNAESSPWFKQWYAYMQALKTQSHLERLMSAAAMMPPGSAVWGEDDFVASVEAQAAFNLAVLQYASVMDYGLTDSGRFARIQCPILMMVGTGSFAVGQNMPALEAAQAAWRNGQLIRFEGAGHFIHADAFPAFLESVRQFMAEHLA